MSDPMKKMAAIVHSAYKCHDCKAVRAVTIIPAVIDGQIVDDGVTAEDCSACYSTNIETLFQTTSASESAAYLRVISLTTDSAGKDNDLQTKMQREMELLRKLDKDE